MAFRRSARWPNTTQSESHANEKSKKSPTGNLTAPFVPEDRRGQRARKCRNPSKTHTQTRVTTRRGRPTLDPPTCADFFFGLQFQADHFRRKNRHMFAFCPNRRKEASGLRLTGDRQCTAPEPAAPSFLLTLSLMRDCRFDPISSSAVQRYALCCKADPASMERTHHRNVRAEKWEEAAGRRPVWFNTASEGEESMALGTLERP